MHNIDKERQNPDPWLRPSWEERLEQIVSGAALVADRGNARGIVEAGNSARQALQAGLKLNIQKKNGRSEPKFLVCPQLFHFILRKNIQP